MEINKEEQIKKLQGELKQIAEQLQRVDQTRQQLANALLKKQGAIELLEGLENEKPNEPA